MQVIEVPIPTGNTSHNHMGRHGCELYMKRHNRYYFKQSDGTRIIMELNPAPPALKELKYGSKVDLNWSY